MNEERLTAALRRFGEHSPHERPLPPDAGSRIEARMDAAFDAACAAPEPSDITDLVPIERPGPGRRRRVGGLVAAAAAIVVLVAALVVRQPSGPESATDEPIQPVPVALLEPGTRWVLATGLDLDADERASSASVAVSIGGDLASATEGERVVGGEARISTGDAPPLQYLGSVRFVVEASGSVRVPLILLDPERPWVDCDSTIDVSAGGDATCGSDNVEYEPGDTTRASVDTPVGQFEATGRLIDWSVSGSADQYQTTIWSAAGVGPVGIEINDGDTVRTYELTTLDRPTTEPTGS